MASDQRQGTVVMVSVPLIGRCVAGQLNGGMQARRPISTAKCPGITGACGRRSSTRWRRPDAEERRLRRFLLADAGVTGWGPQGADRRWDTGRTALRPHGAAGSLGS